MFADYLTSLAGGVLIGLAALLLMLFNGRIAGISGILSGALWSSKGVSWQWYFLAGLLLSGLVSGLLSGLLFVSQVSLDNFSVGMPLLLLSGFLVGLGSSFGNGCTSGHGVCGIGRLSLRSIVATCIFMSVAFVVASLLH